MMIPPLAPPWTSPTPEQLPQHIAFAVMPSANLMVWQVATIAAVIQDRP